MAKIWSMCSSRQREGIADDILVTHRSDALADTKQRVHGEAATPKVSLYKRRRVGPAAMASDCDLR